MVNTLSIQTFQELSYTEEIYDGGNKQNNYEFIETTKDIDKDMISSLITRS